MNIDQVRYFEVVFEKGSFSAAARVQYVTVQAVSKAIADLERGLGQALFIRENRGVRPTEFGLAFHVKALPALTAFKSLETLAENYGEVESYRPLHIMLCAPVFPGNEVVLPNLAKLFSKAADVEVDMSLATVEEGLTALLDERVGTIITIGECSRQGIECIPIGAAQTAVLVKKGHPLASENTVTVQDLNQFSVLLARSFDDFAESIMSLYSSRGLASPFARVASDGAEEVDRLMDEGAYAFCVNISTMVSQMPDMVMVPIDPADAELVPICICTLKGKSVPGLKTLIRMASNPAVLMSMM